MAANDMSGALPRALMVEREEIVEQLAAIADDAARGRGRLVLLSGEAGVGKTTLVEALLDSVADSLTIRRGASDNVTTPAPLGPFLEAVPELVDVSVPASGEDSSMLFRTATGVLSSPSSVVVLEDLHWADGASLDLLRHLGRRVDRMPLMLVVTFRSDELDDAHPLRMVLGDLATAPGVARIAVPALTRAGVEQLAVAVGSGLDVAGLHERTGGNAFHVTEVLAAGSDEVPSTVRDAVLARVSRLSDGARRALDAAAVLGPGADVAILAAVADRPLSDVDECVARGMLRSDGSAVTFRHELARLAVEEALTLESRRELHSRALAELKKRDSTDDRRMAHHAQEADDRDALLEHSLRAADLAAARGAHREAAEHHKTVLGVLSAQSPRRPSVLDSLGNALCLLGRAEEALTIEHEALELHRSSQDPRGAGRSLRRISRLSWMLGRGAVSDQFARRAIEILEPEGPAHELAMAYSNLAQIHMLSEDAGAAGQWGERALAMASDLGDEFVRSHALNNVGSAIATTDDLETGCEMLRESLRIALDHGFVDHAARA
jgi:predicted ATPase